MFGFLAQIGEDDEDSPKKNKPPFPDLHLQMPLTIHEIDNIYHGTGTTRWAKAAHQSYKELERILSVTIHHPYPRFIHTLGSILLELYNSLYTIINEDPIWEAAYLDQLMWMRNTWNGMGGGQLDYNDIDNLPMLSAEIKHYMAVRERLERITQYSALANSKRKAMIPDSVVTVGQFFECEVKSNLYIYVGNDCSVLSYADNYILLNHNMLLCMTDIISSRSITLATCYISHKIAPLIYPTHNLILKLYTWGDKILELLGNNGYKVIKNIEGVMVGLLQTLDREDPVCNQDAFLNSSLQGIYELLGEDNCYNDSLREILRELSERPSHWTSQLSGLFRHWGHPLLQSVDGLLEIKRLGLREKPCNMYHNVMVTGEFKRLFSENYFSRHKKWPRLDMSRLASRSEIKRAYIENREVDKSDMFYDNHEWAEVHGVQNFPVPEGFNWASVLSDKSHSPLLSELKENIKGGRVQGKSIGKRLLLSWLKDTFPSPPALLKRINDLGFFADELLLGVRPKEREMKTKPRMFAQLPLAVRLYFVITEQLIGDNILKNLGVTTMKDSYIDLVKRMFAMSSSQSEKSDTVVCIINIDFMKWNTELRHQMVKGVFEFIDELHGFDNLVTRTHEFFEQAMIYLADGSANLQLDDAGEIIPDITWYKGHKGGLEGIRQKGWTAYTGALLSMIASRYKIQVKIMGQGDNQVLACHFKASRFDVDGSVLPEEYDRIKNELNAFMDDLENTCEQVGMNIKREETWISSKLFAYGKQLFLNGVPLSMGLKRICRASHMTNDTYPSLNNSLQVIGTSAEGMCMSDYSPFSAILIGQTEMRRCIQTYIEYDISIGKGYTDLKRQELSFSYNAGNKKVIRKLSLSEYHDVLDRRIEFCNVAISIGAAIGGFNIIIPYEFLTRGFPDPVTCQFSYLIYLLKCDLSEMERVWICNALRPIYKEKVDYFLLFSDPVSINIENSRKEDNVVKSFVKGLLTKPEYQRNIHFKNIMHNAAISNDKVIEYLSTMTPLKPRIAADLLDATPMGYALSIMHRFEKTSTLIGKAYDERGDTISDALAKCSREGVIAFIYQLVNANDHLPIPTCSAAHSQLIRTESWKREDIEDVTVAHPLETFNVHRLNNNRCTFSDCKTDGVGYVEIRIDEKVQREGKEGFLMTLGSSSPYIGSGTNEKQQGGKIVKVENLNSLLSKPILIQRLMPFAVKDHSNISYFIRELVSLITDAEPSLFSDPTVSSSGSVGHRYKDTYTKHGGYSNNLYTPYTYIHINTTSLSRYSKGKANYNLHFQNMLSSCQELVVMDIMNVRDLHSCRMYHLHEECKTCLTLMSDSLVDTPERHDPNMFRGLVRDEYMWVAKKDLELVYPLLLDLEVPSLRSDYDIDNYRRALSYRIGQEAYNIGKSESVSNILTTSQRITNLPLIWYMRCDFTWLVRGFLDEFIMKHLTRISSRGNNERPTNEDLLDFLQSRLLSLTPIEVMALLPGYVMKQNQSVLQSYGYNLMIGTSFDITIPSVTKCIKDVLYQMLTEKGFTDPNTQPVFVFEPNRGAISIDTILRVIMTRYRLRQRTFTQLDWYDISILLHIVSKSWLEYQSISSEHNIYPSLNKFLSSYELQINLWGQFETHLLNEIYDKILTRDTVFCKDGTFDSLSKEIPPLDLLAPIYQQIPLLNYQVHELEDAFTVINISDNPVSKKSVKPVFTNMVIRNDMIPVETLMKPVNLSTTAHYKFLSVFSPLIKSRAIQETRNILCLGDGTGGTVLLCHRLFNPDIVIFNTYVSIGSWIPQSINEIQCPSIENFPSYKERTIGIDLLRNGYTDFTDPNYYSVLTSYLLSNKVSELSIITCDAETDLSTSNIDVIYVYSVLKLTGLLSPKGVIVMKIYGSEDHTVKTICGMFSYLFEMVHIYRSHFSNKGNTELYIVAYRKRPGRSILRYAEMEKLYMEGVDITIVKKAMNKVNLSDHTANGYSKLLDSAVFKSKFNMAKENARRMLHVPLGVKPILSSETCKWMIRSSISNYKSTLLGSVTTGTSIGLLTQDIIDKVATQMWILINYSCGGVSSLSQVLKTQILKLAAVCYVTGAGRQVLLVFPDCSKKVIDTCFRASVKYPNMIHVWRIKQIKVIEKATREILQSLSFLRSASGWEGSNSTSYQYVFSKTRDKKTGDNTFQILLGGTMLPRYQEVRNELQEVIHIE